MKSINIWLCVLILVLMPTALADDDPNIPWPIEERCVGGPTLPPVDWSYTGTLLMSGYAGIHARQADWETPRVVAFFNNNAIGDYPVSGGQLSPDERWYATPIGERFREVSFNIYTFVDGVRLYSMVDDTVHEFSVDEFTERLEYYPVAWSYLPIEWVDNQSLLMGNVRLYPFEDRTEASSVDTGNLSLVDQYLSPDHTRLYGNILYERSVGRGLFDPTDPEATFEEIGDLDNVVWKRDSSGFIAEDRDTNTLSLYDRDGVLIEQIHTLDDNRIQFDSTGARSVTRWSPDHTRFAYVLDLPYPEPNRLHIIDFEQRTVINTCLRPVSRPMWSPDGEQLAFLALARENLRIVIMDVGVWQAYDVGRHSGRVGTNQPGMMGWFIDA